MERNKANLVMLKYLISKGELVTDESIYGDTVDYEGQKQAKANIDGYLKPLKWNQSDAPKTNSEPEFLGTFVENGSITCLTSTLVFGKRRVEKWKLKLDDDLTFSELLTNVLEFEHG